MTQLVHFSEADIELIPIGRPRAAWRLVEAPIASRPRWPVPTAPGGHLCDRAA